MNKKLWLLRILIILLIAFIWIHSMMPRSASSTESNAVTGFLSNIFPGISNDFVRKAAHFCEYAALGFLFSLYAFVLNKKHNIKHLVNLLFSGLFVAVIDETIQIFSARGPQITDVWLDVLGVTVVALVIYLSTHKQR